jgi:hypothetical protein
MFTPICLFETEYLGPRGAVLIEFDQSTMANMTAALEHVCRKIPADIDNYETRKFIADAMMASARAGKRSLINFQEAGLEALTKLGYGEIESGQGELTLGAGSWPSGARSPGQLRILQREQTEVRATCEF